MTPGRPPLWVRLVRRLAGLWLPRELRARGEEMAAVFEERYRAARRRGTWATLGFVIGDLADLVATGVRLRWRPRSGGRGSSGKGGAGMWTGSWKDLQVAMRALARRPGFVAVASITLALGIGANTAMFSVLNTVVLRPLPYPQADELVAVWHTIPSLGWERGPFSYPYYSTVRERAGRLGELEMFTGTQGTILGEGPPERVRGARVSGGLFPMLGVEAALGRVLQPADDDPGAEPVVVLGHELWTRLFGADPAIVGRLLRMDSGSPRVVGIMPPTFPGLGRRDEYWVPIALDAEARAADLNYLQVIGRLADGADIGSARVEVEGILAAATRDDPEARDRHAHVESLHDLAVGGVRAQLLVLLGAVGLVLLAACANVAGLTLARAAARRREYALRRALGAGRAHLVRYLMAESAILAALGGSLALGVAYALTGVVARYGPAELPRRADIGVDPTATAFLFAVSIACVFVFGLLPAVKGARSRPKEMLRDGITTGRHGGRSSAQTVLAGLQVSLALVLMVGGGLLTRSLMRMQSVALGFDPEGVVVGRVPLAGAEAEERIAFADGTLERLTAVPGVARAAFSWNVPFGTMWASTSVVAEGSDVPRASRPQAQMIPVRGPVFEVLGMRMLEGESLPRAIGPEDPLQVVVNRTFAETLWPSESAVGKRFRRGNDPDSPWNTVLGVVDDVRARGVTEPVEPAMYQPLTQAGWAQDAYVVVRAAGVDPLDLVTPLRTVVAEWDPELAVDQVATLESMVRAGAAAPRFRAWLVGGFALLVGVLAVVGVYGVMGLLVAGRIRDIGVRMALGAPRGAVVRAVLGEGALIALVGVAVGLLGALAVSDALESLLYDIAARDPLTYMGAAVLLTAATMAAALLPARRAARVDPLRVLREE